MRQSLDAALAIEPNHFETLQVAARVNQPVKTRRTRVLETGGNRGTLRGDALTTFRNGSRAWSPRGGRWRWKKH